MPKIIRAKLNDEQREEFHRKTRETDLKPRYRDRLEIVRLSDAGFAIPKIAVILDQSEQRVRYWLKRFLEGGFDALSDAPHLGPSSALTPEILEHLRAEIRKGERTWTASQLSEWLFDSFGVKLCAEHLSRRLKREGFVWKRTSRSLRHERKAEETEAKRSELADFEKRGTTV